MSISLRQLIITSTRKRKRQKTSITICPGLEIRNTNMILNVSFWKLSFFEILFAAICLQVTLLLKYLHLFPIQSMFAHRLYLDACITNTAEIECDKCVCVASDINYITMCLIILNYSVCLMLSSPKIQMCIYVRHILPPMKSNDCLMKSEAMIMIICRNIQTY